MKKLTRSRGDKLLAGVMGGIAKHIEADPTVVRLIAVILMLLTGFFPFALVYVLMAVIVPQEAVVAAPSAGSPVDVPAVEVDGSSAT